MEYFLIISVVLMIGATFYLNRSMNSIYKAGYERKQIINAIFFEKDWIKYLEMYKEVSFNSHERALFWGRDSSKLYDPELVEIVNKYNDVKQSY